MARPDHGEWKGRDRDTNPRLTIQDLSANVAASGLSARGKSYGDLKLTAANRGGKVNFTLASNLGGASIQGHGSAQNAKDYPVDAQLSLAMWPGRAWRVCWDLMVLRRQVLICSPMGK